MCYDAIMSLVSVLYPLTFLIYYHVMVCSRDDQEVGMAHEIASPKNQPQFSQVTMGQYWLGKTKLKQALRLIQNAFKKLI